GSNIRANGVWKGRMMFAASAVALVGLCLLVRHFASSSAKAEFAIGKGKQTAQQTAAQSGAQAQQASAQMPKRERPQHDVMAAVNGQEIRRDALATACVERNGKQVLEGIVNKRLIQHYCRNRQ